MSNFKGYLLKIGNIPFPDEFIEFNSYKPVPDRQQDLNPFRSENGELTRNVVQHKPSTLDFQSRPMNDDELAQIRKILATAYINVDEEKVIIEFWRPNRGDYRTGTFYLDPNTEYPIKKIEDNQVYYDTIKWSFVEY